MIGVGFGSGQGSAVFAFGDMRRIARGLLMKGSGRPRRGSFTIGINALANSATSILNFGPVFVDEYLHMLFINFGTEAAAVPTESHIVLSAGFFNKPPADGAEFTNCPFPLFMVVDVFGSFFSTGLGTVGCLIQESLPVGVRGNKEFPHFAVRLVNRVGATASGLVAGSLVTPEM